jgi:hypothetical protein
MKSRPRVSERGRVKSSSAIQNSAAFVTGQQSSREVKKADGQVGRLSYRGHNHAVSSPTLWADELALLGVAKGDTQV